MLSVQGHTKWIMYRTLYLNAVWAGLFSKCHNIVSQPYLRRSMRYFLTLSYKGTHFAGWQVQPNAASVQATLEAALETILREKTPVTGCGRTDAGVHAQYFVAHFDAKNDLPTSLLNSLNSLLPDDIAIQHIRVVADEAHARFDAFERGYEYHISTRKDPFSTQTAWHYPMHAHLDFDKMQEMAAILPLFSEFFPFCKTNSGVEHYRCTLLQAHWEKEPEQARWVFHIRANRFLRGMVRLIVGASIQVGRGQLEISQIEEALQKQIALPKSLSVPPHGLFLTDVKYPF